jgi:hypothetical protein
VGYVVGRALEGAFLARFGFETHSWRPIDGPVPHDHGAAQSEPDPAQCRSARRPPDLGLVMVALWTIASLGFHALRLAAAERERARRRAIAPWEDA